MVRCESDCAAAGLSTVRRKNFSLKYRGLALSYKDGVFHERLPIGNVKKGGPETARLIIEPSLYLSV